MLSSNIETNLGREYDVLDVKSPFILMICPDAL